VKYPKPKIIISKCLEFDACRYDGQLIANKFIDRLKDFIDFMPICPEVEVGMGTPRDPIHIEKKDDNYLLPQPKTGNEFSKKINSFSDDFIKSIKQVDGFILKHASPSCGISSAKIYTSNSMVPIGKGDGLFASKIIQKFPNHPKEEEKRLNNTFLREHFLTSIFTIADFRNVDSIDSLYKYHAKHKYLFMSYNQNLMREMGRIAANAVESKIDVALKLYYDSLLAIFKKRSRYQSNINTHMHIMGYFKKDITSNEKKHFLDILERYREKKVPISSVNSILSSWIHRFHNEYLMNQSFLQPFPVELIDSNNSRFF
tara:strand:+ start:408 stop:1352 length:945 start_codon:yes stop_codon:yes gene_type:complete